MSLSPGTRIGSYEVLSLLGAGGMGEVYRGRDTNLGRDVAIKVLSAAVAGDRERIARFQREAQLLASLNHPNIGAIYGLERDGGTQFLVLELVEGQTLADRLKRGSLPTDEALAIARQIADALEAAHEKSIIHRDLKPGNIMLTPDGQVKVLDFGLAKAVEATSAADQSMSPTLTLAATQAGVILGTAAYMAPEQAKGRVADKRCDVWAFGCVLYEMLTGRRAFEGEDLTDTIAAVVRAEPDWSALPATVPEHIRLLIRRCLEKDRRARVADISTARFLMHESVTSSMSRLAGPPTASTMTAHVPSAPSRRASALAASVVGLAVGGVLAGTITWALTRPVPPSPRTPIRFTIAPPAGYHLVADTNADDLDISRDGTRVLFRAGEAQDAILALRTLGDLEAHPVSGAERARNPFISPDGQWAGFFVDQQIWKVSLSGGERTPVARVTGSPRGASWSDTGTIVFATSDLTNGLQTVSASGGEPQTITTIDAGQADHHSPVWIPGRNAILFSIGMSLTLSSDIAVLDLDTRQSRILIPGGSQPHFVHPGYVVYADPSGTLRAVRFDTRTLEIAGEPVPIGEQVQMTTGRISKFAVALNGAIAYAPGGDAPAMLVPRTLTWVDRRGREDVIDAPEHSYAAARVSPDGTRVVLDVRDSGSDLWIWDLARRTLSRMTNDPANDLSPVWTADSRRIVFASSRAGSPNVYVQAADGTGTPERLTTHAQPHFPVSLSPDQQHLVLFELGAAVDLQMIAMSEPGKVAPLLKTPASETGGEISPDGRWLAYQSNESGTNEVYVRPFPNVDGAKWTVSPTGGTRPVWSRDGSELFYLDGKGLLTSVPITAKADSFVAGVPRTVLTTPYYPGYSLTGADLRAYDVSPDGQRFLMIKENQSASERSAGYLVVVLDWLETLRAATP